MGALAPWLLSSFSKLKQWREQGNFHHALLMTGAVGVGQNEFAQHAAQLLLCEFPHQAPCERCHSCQVRLAGTHPDLHILDGRESGIKVDAVRQIVTKVTNKPQLGYSKVVIIHEAHEMNINAANALLKVLEEPPKETYFLLTSHTSRALMPTILSRCQRLSLPTPNDEQVHTWLKQTLEQDVSGLLWFAAAPFQLMQLCETNQMSLIEKLPTQFSAWLLGAIRADELVALASKENTLLFVEGLQILIGAAIEFSASGHCHADLRELVQHLLQRYDIYRLFAMSQQLTELRTQLDKTNLNPTMQLTAVLNAW